LGRHPGDAESAQAARLQSFCVLAANAVERFFNKLKHFRAIATRYDKRDNNYRASIQLASMRIWLRFNESVI